MPRYDRFWQPVTGDTQPSQVVTVDCESVVATVSESPLVEREWLQRWHCCTWRTANGVPSRMRAFTDTTQVSFWTLLDKYLLPKTSTWIIMPLACRNLALLGFWSQLERGDCYVTGSNRQDADRGTSVLPTVLPNAAVAGPAGPSDVVRQVPQLQLESDKPSADVARLVGAVDKEHSNGCLVIEDPPTVIACQRLGRSGAIVIVDTANYGCDPDCWGSTPEERTQAVAGWWQRLCGRLSGNGFGGVKATCGSIAVNSLKRQPGQRLPYVHTFGKRLSLERAAYYGGRCEAFRIGRIRGPVYHLDVRSLYPSVMATKALPHSPGENIDVNDYQSILDAITAGCAVGDVTIVSAHADYPVSVRSDTGLLPTPIPYWSGETTGASARQVIYPVGEYRTCLCGPELLDALIHDRIRRVHACTTYQMSHWLRDWSLKWLALLASARAANDVPMQQCCKRVLVSLVGKFGESGRSWETVVQDTLPGAYCQWQQVGKYGQTEKYRNVAWTTQRESVRPESDWSVPYVAGFITAHGRVRLLQLIRLADRGDCYYCDTDSLVCNYAAYARLCQSDEVRDGELGYLRLLGVHEQAEVWGVKHYSLDGVVKCAGLPRGTVSPGIDSGSYWFREHIGSQAMHGQTPEAERSLHAYQRRSRYLHGVVGGDGTVTPWQLRG